MIVMKLMGAADGTRLPDDGKFMKSFDFEAFDGQGEAAMTKDIHDALKFETLEAALEFRNRSPKCKPLRRDGLPNRPLTSTNWLFEPYDEPKPWDEAEIGFSHDA
jgi:hypothetical protein